MSLKSNTELALEMLRTRLDSLVPASKEDLNRMPGLSGVSARVLFSIQPLLSVLMTVTEHNTLQVEQNTLRIAALEKQMVALEDRLLHAECVSDAGFKINVDETFDLEQRMKALMKHVDDRGKAPAATAPKPSPVPDGCVAQKHPASDATPAPAREGKLPPNDWTDARSDPGWFDPLVRPAVVATRHLASEISNPRLQPGVQTVDLPDLPKYLSMKAELAETMRQFSDGKLHFFDLQGNPVHMVEYQMISRFTKAGDSPDKYLMGTFHTFKTGFIRKTNTYTENMLFVPKHLPV